MKAKMQRTIVISLAVMLILVIPAIVFNLDMFLSLTGYSTGSTRMFITPYSGKYSEDTVYSIHNTIYNANIGSESKIMGVRGVRLLAATYTAGEKTGTITLRNSTDDLFYHDKIYVSHNGNIGEQIIEAKTIADGEIYFPETMTDPSVKGSDIFHLSDQHKKTYHNITQVDGKQCELSFPWSSDAKPTLTAKLYVLDTNDFTPNYLPDEFVNFAYVNKSEFESICKASEVTDLGYSLIEADIQYEKYDDISYLSEYIQRDLGYGVNYKEMRYEQLFAIARFVYILLDMAWFSTVIYFTVRKYIQSENMRIYGAKRIPDGK